MSVWLRRLIALFRTRHLEDELDAEIRAHLALATEVYERQGLSRAEARLEARRRFGGIDQTKERYRDLRSFRCLEDLGQDVRIGLRSTRKHLAFTTVVVATLALGIGANAAVFTVVNTLLFTELPVPTPAEVVKIYTSDFSGGLYGGSSYPDFADYRDRATSFVHLAAYSTFVPVNLGTDHQSARIQGAIATHNFFEVLQLQPAVGGFFPPGDDLALGSAPVTVLGYELWQSHFGGDPTIVGRDITINGFRFTIVGVAPEGFRGIDLISPSALWIPMAMVEQAVPRRAGSNILDLRGSRWLQMVGRLAPGATIDEAQAELTILTEGLAQAHPETNLGTLQQPDRARPVSLLPAATIAAGPLDQELLSRVSGLLMAVVGVVLLITCANIANLLLARGQARRREIGVRQALGAGRGRLLRQLLTESTLLALLGGAAGLALGLWSTRAFSALLPHASIVPGLELPEFAIDWRVLVFTATLSLATGIMFGLVPALQAARASRLSSLRQTSSDPHGTHPLLKASLVVAQLALSLVLLVSAGLFMRSLQAALSTDPGFNRAGVLLADLDVGLQGYDEARGRALYRALAERVGALPGIEIASVAAFVPVTPRGSRTTMDIEGYAPRPSEDMELNFNRVGPRYFRTMGIAIIRGRGFRDDAVDTPVRELVINQAFARRYWPGQDPLGRQVRVGGADAETSRVVGVVQDGRYRTLREVGVPYVYLPIGSSYAPEVTLLARADGDPMARLSSVRAVVGELDPALPMFGERSLDDQLADATTGERVVATLLGIFGSVALLLAVVGVYGVGSQAARQRTHEVGVRMALGADAAAVRRLLAGRGLRLVVVGSLIGLVLSFLATRLLGGLLFGIEATDPWRSSRRARCSGWRPLSRSTCRRAERPGLIR